MVGGLTLRDCLRRAEVAEITSIGRRRTGVEDPRLTEVVHREFTDFGAIAASFEHRDVALFCLGAYTGAVPDRDLREITVDYAVAFADALQAGSPRAAIRHLRFGCHPSSHPSSRSAATPPVPPLFRCQLLGPDRPAEGPAGFIGQPQCLQELSS